MGEHSDIMRGLAHIIYALAGAGHSGRGPQEVTYFIEFLLALTTPDECGVLFRVR